jgi:hypothetical protein
MGPLPQVVTEKIFQGPFKMHAILAIKHGTAAAEFAELEASLTHMARTVSSTKAIHYFVDEYV